MTSISMIETILEKILLGISLAAPIGPVSLEMIQRGIHRGFWAAFSIRLGGVIGNTLCLIAAFFGLAAVKENVMVMTALGTLGVWCLLWIGFSNLAKVNKPVDFSIKSQSHNSNGLYLGFLLAVFNPIGLAFWLGTFVQTINNGVENSFLALVQNFFILAGVLIWGALLSLVLNFGRLYLNQRVIQGVTALAGLLLLCYGCHYSQRPALDISLIGILFWVKNYLLKSFTSLSLKPS